MTTPIAQLIAELRDEMAGVKRGYADRRGELIFRAAEALARQEELLAAVLSAEAWLDRWAAHVGHCRGGDLCECGLTAIRAEVSAAARLSDKLKGE